MRPVIVVDFDGVIVEANPSRGSRRWPRLEYNFRGPTLDKPRPLCYGLNSVTVTGGDRRQNGAHTA